MARRNSGDDADFNIFNSNESIERQTAQWEKAAKDVTNHVIDYMESRLSRMNANLKKELGTSNNSASSAQSLLAQTIATKRKQATDQSNSTKSSGWKESFMANVAAQSGKGEKFDPNRSFMKTAGKELVGLLEKAFSIYIARPITTAISDMASAYESNFTDIAGRMGTDRKTTANLMQGAVKQLNASAYKNAINANKELIPELKAVAAKGWQGSEAISVALTNSVDKKIMPWLDSSTEAWSNLQFNLKDGQLKTLKSQQLLLQESQTGNRLLQSGVINSMMSDIAPILSNIDFNTMETDKLAPQMQAYMESLTERGYTPQEAYEEARKIMQIYKDPASGFREGNAYGVLASEAAYLGGDFEDIAKATRNLDEMLGNLGNNASIAAPILGGTTATGINRSEAFSQRSDAIQNTDWDKYTSATASEYDKAVRNANEKVTATTEWDNRLQNMTTQLLYPLNKIAHGVDILDGIAKAIGGIVGGVITSKIGKSVLSKFAPDLLKQGSKASFMSKGASLLSKASTMFPGVEAGTGGIAATGSLSATLGSIGGGSAVLGGAAALAPLAAGAAVGGYGIKSGISDISEGAHKARGIASIAGGAAATAGGLGVAGGMLAAGAANAWNPVGWGLLLGGAVTVAGTAIHRWAENLDQADEQAEAHYKSMAKTYDEGNKETKRSYREMYLTLKDSNASQQEIDKIKKDLVNKGLLSESAAANASVEALQTLTKAYLNAAEDFDGKKKDYDKFAVDYAKEMADNNKKSFDDVTKSLVEKAKNEKWDSMSEGDKARFRETHKKKIVGGGRTQEVDYTDEELKNLLDLRETDTGLALLQMYENMATQSGGDAEKRYNALTANGRAVTAADFSQHYGSDDFADVKNAVTKNKDIDVNETMLSAIKGAHLSDAYGYIDTNKLVEDMATAGEIAHIIDTLYASYKTTKDEATAESIIANYQKLKEFNLDDKQKGALQKLVTTLPAIASSLKADGYTVPSYAVGTPYISKDHLAQVHKGEAIIPSNENKARLRSMLGISSTEVAQTKISSEDIVNAIQSQTNTLKQALDNVISAITSMRASGGVGYNTRQVGTDLSKMNPVYGNTRNLYST